MKTHYLIITVFLMIAGQACMDLRRSGEDQVIATVAGKTLTLEQAFEEIPPFILNQDTLNTVYTYADKWVQSQVAIDHARRIGIQNTSEFQKKMNRYQEQLLEHLLREYVLDEHIDEMDVTRDEALSYYQTHRDQFVFDENYVRFRHLTTRTRAEAERANSDLVRGVEWEEIVQEYSIDPELQLRQSTQFYPVSMALADTPPLHQNLQILGITERSPIHFYDGQYHFIQLVEEKTEGEYPDLDWLIPKIQNWLKLEKARRITNAYLRNLYLQADANNEIDLANVSEIQHLLADD